MTRTWHDADSLKRDLMPRRWERDLPPRRRAMLAAQRAANVIRRALGLPLVVEDGGTR